MPEETNISHDNISPPRPPRWPGRNFPGLFSEVERMALRRHGDDVSTIGGHLGVRMTARKDAVLLIALAACRRWRVRREGPSLPGTGHLGRVGRGIVEKLDKGSPVEVYVSPVLM